MNFLSEKSSTTVTQNLLAMETSNTNILSIDNTSDITKNDEQTCLTNKTINQIWTKENFDPPKLANQKKNYVKASLSLDIKPLKMTWASKKSEDISEEEDDDDHEMNDSTDKGEIKEVFSPTPSTPDKESTSPSHHARRPMNAFLIFCKKHRPIVRQRFPHLENRGVTRILGEWWALLETNEKSSYTSLAKEYKDAFFSANPDFKWYKLPAPPLRTLNTRPLVIHKTSPLASPTQTTPNSADFTPGKLADETQLGNLTSLMRWSGPSSVSKTTNNNITVYKDSSVDNKKTDLFVCNNNNVEKDNEHNKRLSITPPVVTTKVTELPPKPIKKRKIIFEDDDDDNKTVVRDIFNDKLHIGLDQNENSFSEQQHNTFEKTVNRNNGFHNNEPENLTQQELMNKVVDSMFPEKDQMCGELDKVVSNKTKSKIKETRKSGRSCKGKRYAEFMIEGKLLGNKQMKKFSQYNFDVKKFDNELNDKIGHIMHNKLGDQSQRLDLGDTIKRLAERTNTKLEDIDDEGSGEMDTDDNVKQKRTESDDSDDGDVKTHSDFNLDLRITELPSLNYETFLQRKRESKKRKSIRSKSESSVTKTKVVKLSKYENNCMVGSKKRKNKSSITRLEKPTDSNYMSDPNNDLYGLATLAEIASNTEKIN